MKVLGVVSARVVDFCGNSKPSSHSRRRSSTAEQLQKEHHHRTLSQMLPPGFEHRTIGSESKLLHQRTTDS